MGKRAIQQDIHPGTREHVRDGTLVIIRDANGKFHERIALSPVQWGRDFLVVWVARRDEAALARREDREPDSVPWPAEDVWLRSDAPGLPDDQPPPVTARAFTWDWREQPDMAAIASFVAEISDGKVVMTEVETGSDQYAWVVADHPVSEEEAMELYRA